MENINELVWKKCSSCKKPIAYGALYWVCNVSTCNRKRTALSFCTVSCWDAHLGMLRHRESWAEERTAPTLAQWKEALALGGDWPIKPAKEAKKEEPASAAKSSSPKVIRRSGSL